MRKSLGAIALAMALAIGVQGCYGSFSLTRKLWKFNGSLGNKFVNEVVFLVFNFVPVYGIAGFVDAVVLNSIEFWGGKNPARASVVKEGEHMAKLQYDPATDRVKISYFNNGQLWSEGYLERKGESVQLLAADGKTVRLHGSQSMVAYAPSAN